MSLLLLAVEAALSLTICLGLTSALHSRIRWLPGVRGKGSPPRPQPRDASVNHRDVNATLYPEAARSWKSPSHLHCSVAL